MKAARLLLICSVAIISLGSTGAEGAAKRTSADSKAPLKVTSTEMVTDRKNNTIVFIGSVVAVKGQLTIKAEELTVWTDNSQREFKKIVAQGNVRITRAGKTATGDEAEYFNENPKTGQEEKIEIKGNAYLKDGKHTATGKVVVYYFKSEDMKIEGDTDKPAEVTFFPDDDAASAAPEPERQSSSPLFGVQAASYSSKVDADQLVSKLSVKGYSAHVTSAMVNKIIWYRVRVDGFESMENAGKAAERMRIELGLKPLIIQLGE